MYDVFNELHDKAAMSAQSSGMSLNAYIQKGLAAALLSEHHPRKGMHLHSRRIGVWF